jgi:hypothetical protein
MADENRKAETPPLPGMKRMTVLEYFGPDFIAQFNALADKSRRTACILRGDEIAWVARSEDAST